MSISPSAIEKSAARPASRGSLFIISAPSGGGKTSLTLAVIKRLEARGISTLPSVSYTTRAARAAERNGVDYHFIDDARFSQMIKQGDFLEFANVFGRHYGTGHSRTEVLLARGHNLVLDIDWQGARQVRALIPESVGIFILPPSLEILEQRLRSRGQDDGATVKLRMDAARLEMAHYAEYDYLVVNDDFERALGELEAIFVANRLKNAIQQARHADLIKQLVR
jgi:guanylate kinase